MKGSEQHPVRRSMQYRADILYILAALTPPAGLLLPLPAWIIDIGWVCSLSLTASLIIICLLAKNTSQLHGFAPLLASTILLRLFLTAASLKTILLSTASPVLITLLGDKFTRTQWAPAALTAAILLPACLWMVFHFAAAMRRAAFHFATHILPLKRAGLQADLNLAIISRRQAQLLLEKIREESGLFVSFTVSSTLLRIESAAAAFLLPTLIALKAFFASSQPQWLPQDTIAIFSHATGLACLLFIPAALSAWACASLTSKEKLSLQAQPVDSKEPQSAKVSIVSANSGRVEQVELLNPDFTAKPAENIVDFEPSPARSDSDLFAVQSLPQDSPEKYYQGLYQMLDLALTEKIAPAVLTSRTLAELPVTVAVNIAILLTRLRGRLLLIDTDCLQSPIARVFDIDPKLARLQPQLCCIEKLHLLTTDPADKPRLFMENLQKLQSQFEMILIYAPQTAQTLPPEIVRASHIFLFADTDKPQTTTPAQLGQSLSLRLLTPLQTSA